MAISQFVAWLREPQNSLRIAAIFTVLAVLLIAPIYLGAQWGPAQSPTAPWWVALVREPFFARIMLFGEGPAFWPLFVTSWAIALGFWGLTISARRKRIETRVVPSASNSNETRVDLTETRAA